MNLGEQIKEITRRAPRDEGFAADLAASIESVLALTAWPTGRAQYGNGESIRLRTAAGLVGYVEPSGSVSYLGDEATARAIHSAMPARHGLSVEAMDGGHYALRVPQGGPSAPSPRKARGDLGPCGYEHAVNGACNGGVCDE